MTHSSIKKTHNGSNTFGRTHAQPLSDTRKRELFYEQTTKDRSNSEVINHYDPNQSDEDLGYEDDYIYAEQQTSDDELEDVWRRVEDANMSGRGGERRSDRSGHGTSASGGISRSNSRLISSVHVTEEDEQQALDAADLLYRTARDVRALGVDAYTLTLPHEPHHPGLRPAEMQRKQYDAASEATGA